MNPPKAIKLAADRRFANALKLPGGRSMADAIQGAENRLEAVREDCLTAMDSSVAALQRLLTTRASSSMDLYPYASEVFGLAGTFGLTELSAAADSLCGVLVALQEKGEGATPIEAGGALHRILVVHVDALRTLRSAELQQSAEARSSIVQGLRAVAKKAVGE